VTTQTAEKEIKEKCCHDCEPHSHRVCESADQWPFNLWQTCRQRINALDALRDSLKNLPVREGPSQAVVLWSARKTADGLDARIIANHRAVYGRQTVHASNAASTSARVQFHPCDHLLTDSMVSEPGVFHPQGGRRRGGGKKDSDSPDRTQGRVIP
jgi:hypothetical protein